MGISYSSGSVDLCGAKDRFFFIEDLKGIGIITNGKIDNFLPFCIVITSEEAPR
jgi:hypothetical protein